MHDFLCTHSIVEIRASAKYEMEGQLLLAADDEDAGDVGAAAGAAVGALLAESEEGLLSELPLLEAASPLLLSLDPAALGFALP